MKKLREKMRRLRTANFRDLTTGEKIVKVITSLVKTALIIAAVVAIAGLIFSVAAGIIIAFAIVSAIAGGLADASRAYRPGDQYVRWF